MNSLWYLLYTTHPGWLVALSLIVGANAGVFGVLVIDACKARGGRRARC